MNIRNLIITSLVCGYALSFSFAEYSNITSGKYQTAIDFNVAKAENILSDARQKTNFRTEAFCELFKRNPDKALIKKAFDSGDERVAIVASSYIRNLDSDDASEFLQYLDSNHSTNFKIALIGALSAKKVAGVDDICAKGLDCDDYSFARASILALRNYPCDNHIDALWNACKSKNKYVSVYAMDILSEAPSKIVDSYIDVKLKGDQSDVKTACEIIAKRRDESRLEQLFGMAYSEDKVSPIALTSISKIISEDDFFKTLPNLFESGKIESRYLLQYILSANERFLNEDYFVEEMNKMGKAFPNRIDVASRAANQIAKLKEKRSVIEDKFFASGKVSRAEIAVIRKKHQ